MNSRLLIGLLLVVRQKRLNNGTKKTLLLYKQ
jgi:hypothetical protein